MKITVCIGSSCHLKGSRDVVEQLRQLIADNDLEEKVELAGTFCMNNCQNGVSATLDGELYSLNPDNTEEFFNSKVLPAFRDGSEPTVPEEYDYPEVTE